MGSSLRAKIDEIIEISRREQIEEVLISIGWGQGQFIERLLKALRVLPLPIRLMPDENVNQVLARPLLEILDTQLVELQGPPLTSRERLLKRIIDLVGAAFALLILSPQLPADALLIKIDSKGPAFFSQTRHELNGNKFSILKFGRWLCSRMALSSGKPPRTIHVLRP